MTHMMLLKVWLFVDRMTVFITDEHMVDQVRLIRRSGQVVPWNASKIEVAVRKAFLSFN